ncbi:MAG: 4-hydroxy-3-methylbut-2-enyl diphosphate reductase [Candidatus Omnitrophica bacterium]|nr:4-hydroxy-3-methylbut-2-enyl diphosphate reductase [Candidatus Omnitrophota bacterium]
MKITLAKSAGFCFGVKRAIEIAFKTARLGAKVYMLGDIVHNEDVVKQIQKAGICKIKKLAPGNGKILLIRAHGACQRTFEEAERLGFQIIDATCPMVKEIHRIVKVMELKGYKIIIIGDKKHEEVHGISGQLANPAIIIDPAEKLPLKEFKNHPKACVVVQSTQNLEKVIKIVRALKKHFKELKFFNTVCRTTRLKQEEIMILPKKNDLIIIIGSKTSANTRRLYEIAKSINRNSFWVQSKEEIKASWFKNVQTIGITAGASTPEAITQQVISQIKRITKK